MCNSFQELFDTFANDISEQPDDVQISTAQVAARGILMQTDIHTSLKQLCSCSCNTSSACVLFQALFKEIVNRADKTILAEFGDDIKLCLERILFTPPKEDSNGIDYASISAKERFLRKIFDLLSGHSCQCLEEKLWHICERAAKEIELFYSTTMTEGKCDIVKLRNFEQNLGYVSTTLRIIGTKADRSNHYISDIIKCSERLITKALLSGTIDAKKRVCKRLIVPWFHIAGRERLDELLKGNEFAYVICVEESTGSDFNNLVGNGELINILLNMLEREQQNTKHITQVNTERLIIKPTVVGRAIEKCINHLQESKKSSETDCTKSPKIPPNDSQTWKTFFEVLSAVAEPAVSLLKPAWPRLVKVLECAAQNGPNAKLPSLTQFSAQQLLRFTISHTSTTAIRFLVFNALKFNEKILNSLSITFLLEIILERASHPGIFSPEFRSEAQLLIKNYVKRIFSLCDTVNSKRLLLELLCHRLFQGPSTHPQFIFAVFSGILDVVLSAECKELFSTKAVNDLVGLAKTKFMSQHPCLREQLSILLIRSITPSFGRESQTKLQDKNQCSIVQSTNPLTPDTDYKHIFTMTVKTLANYKTISNLPDVKSLIEILDVLIPKTSFPSNIIKVSHSVIFPTTKSRSGMHGTQDTFIWNLLITLIAPEQRKKLIQDASNLVHNYLDSKRTKNKLKNDITVRHKVSLHIATLASFIVIELIQPKQNDAWRVAIPFWNELQTEFSGLYTSTAFNPNERKGIVHLMASIIDFTSILRHLQQGNKTKHIFRPSLTFSSLYKQSLLPAIKLALGPSMHFCSLSQHLQLLESLLYDVQVEDEELSCCCNAVPALPIEVRQSLNDTVEKVVANAFLLMNTPSPILGPLISPMIAVFILSKITQYDLSGIIDLIAKVKKLTAIPSMEIFCITAVTALLKFEIKIEKKKLPCDNHAKERLNDFIATSVKYKGANQNERYSMIVGYWERLQEDFALSKQLALYNLLKTIKYRTVSPEAKEQCLKLYLECIETVPQDLLVTVLKCITFLIDDTTSSELMESTANTCYFSVIAARNASADVTPLVQFSKMLFKRLISLINKSQGTETISEELQRIATFIDKLSAEEKKYSGPFNAISDVMSSVMFCDKTSNAANVLFGEDLCKLTAKVICPLLIDEPAAERLPGTTEESLSLITTPTPLFIKTGERYKSESGRIMLISRLLSWTTKDVKKETTPSQAIESIFNELLHHWSICTTIDTALKNGVKCVNKSKKNKKDCLSKKYDAPRGSDKLHYQLWTTLNLLLDSGTRLNEKTLENAFEAVLSELLRSPSPPVRWVLIATAIKLLTRLSDEPEVCGFANTLELLKKCLRAPLLKNSALQSFLGIIGHVVINFNLFQEHLLSCQEGTQSSIKCIFRDIISDIFVFLVGPLATKSVALFVVTKMPKCAIEYAFGEQTMMSQISRRFKEAAEFENVKRLEPFYPVLDCAPLLNSSLEESLKALFVLVPSYSKEPGVECTSHVLRYLVSRLRTNDYYTAFPKFTSIYGFPTANVNLPVDNEDIATPEKESPADTLEEAELQRKPIEQNSTRHKRHIIFIASFLEKATNMAGICRTAEIFGVEKLLLPDITILEQQDFQTVCLGSSQWISINELKPYNVPQFLKEMKERGYTLVGIEQTSTSVLLQEFKFPERCVIVVGSEIHGIPAELFQVLDICVEIPQSGKTKSLNAHVASSIVLYEATK